ncbi:hypothetical protein [Brevundimonas denitrificans]|uniref:hypothetical protein n=1 Tax=Brevundimonas denitrificans TaxID=1443434 RepID=UPI00223AEBDF|nr:hypothetical protein [Brevundimonas denitrificans]
MESIEFCAARLEEMRLNFLRLGGSVLEIKGSYQGQFIFIERAGVYFGQTLEGGGSSPWPAPGTAVWPFPASFSARRPRRLKRRIDVTHAA